MTNTKKSKTELTSKERHFGVVLEDINSKFQQVLEGYAGFYKEFKDFRYETRDELRTLTIGQSALLNRMKDLETKLDRLEDDNTSSHKSIMDYLMRIDSEIADVKKKIDHKADLERVEILEKRVISLAAKLK